MILVRNVKLSPDADFGKLCDEVSRSLKVDLPEGTKVKLYKRSLDARKKNNISYSCAVTFEGDDKKLLSVLKKYGAESFALPRYDFKKAESRPLRPIVVGFGPAGMFAALSLAEAGLCPIVLERGRDADRRKTDVDGYFAGGKLSENSNVQFGEGGAGTFSDGKLNTGIKDKRIRAVLLIFAKYGAGEDILYEARPHIGTDVLINVVKNIRKRIVSLGGEVFFEHKLCDIISKNGRVTGITAESPEGEKQFDCDTLILAIGHSARDTFKMLDNIGVALEPKAFAVGTRIEHLQSDINLSQYGEAVSRYRLPAADYRLAVHLNNGRGVFSFCMCPGGVVVNASSENGGVVTNGMSYSKRDKENANAGLLVGIGVEDFYKGNVLDGVDFQREIEKKAYLYGNGKPISQTVGDFICGIDSTERSLGRVKPSCLGGVTMGNICDCLPEFITHSLKEGILSLENLLKGFSSRDAVLTAPETRSSSPIRILRNEAFSSPLSGLYPIGEGAGYAGGITSAAVDGLKAAEIICGE